MQRMFQRIIRAEYSPVPQVSQAPLLAILGQQQNTQHTCCAFRFPRACLELPPHSIRITAATAPPEQNFSSGSRKAAHAQRPAARLSNMQILALRLLTCPHLWRRCRRTPGSC